MPPAISRCSNRKLLLAAQNFCAAAAAAANSILNLNTGRDVRFAAALCCCKHNYAAICSKLPQIAAALYTVVQYFLRSVRWDSHFTYHIMTHATHYKLLVWQYHETVFTRSY